MLRIQAGRPVRICAASAHELAVTLVERKPIGGPTRGRLAQDLWDAARSAEERRVDLDEHRARVTVGALDAIAFRAELPADLADLLQELRLRLGLL